VGRGNNMRVLVTGNAGFIGSNLANALIDLGWEVVGLDNLSTGKKENINPKIEFHQVDLQDSCDRFFKGIDYVYHLAAVPRIVKAIKDPVSAHRNNLSNTVKVLMSSKEAKVKKVIYASSASVYGNAIDLPVSEDTPHSALNPYGVQKYCGELYCQVFSSLYNLSTVCLRFFNVFGPNQATEGDYASVIGIFQRQEREGKHLTVVGDGEQRRDFTYVKDIVSGIIQATLRDVKHGIPINLCAGKNYSILELAECFRGTITYLPTRPGEIKESLGDNRRAKTLIKWEPNFDLISGLKDMKEDNQEETPDVIKQTIDYCNERLKANDPAWAHDVPQAEDIFYGGRTELENVLNFLKGLGK